MPNPRSILSWCAVLALCGTAASAQAAPSAAQRCTALKLDAAARAIVGHVACEARALKQGAPARPTCHGDADARLDATFARVEARGGCPFTSDVGAVDEFVDDLVGQLLGGASSGACGAAKLRAAARKASADLACERVGVRRGVAADPACRAQTLEVLQRRFGETERRHACTQVGDAAAVDAVLAPIVAEIAASVIVGPSAVEPKPKDLVVGITGTLVELGWTPPGSASGNTHVRIVRRLNAAPTGPEDPEAAIVFFGPGTAASETVANLLPTAADLPRVYHYAAFGCTAGGVCESTGSRTTLAPTIAQALRAGGYVLHWRHAAADVCLDSTNLGTAATTAVPNWWKSCNADCGTATARQLNATGVTQATTIGTEFDRLGIPVGRVISSEFCRNFTTAALMDFGPTVELRQDVTFFVYDEAVRCGASYALIHEVPAAGTNTAIIGHAGFPLTCPVLSVLAWGEAAIFKPDGAGGEVLVGRVLADGWAGF